MCLHNVFCRECCLDLMFPYVPNIPECVLSEYLFRFHKFFCRILGLRKVKISGSQEYTTDFGGMKSFKIMLIYWIWIFTIRDRRSVIIALNPIFLAMVNLWFFVAISRREAAKEVKNIRRNCEVQIKVKIKVLMNCQILINDIKTNVLRSIKRI